MAMKPNKFDIYHLSEVNRGEEFKDGKRVFRGYGFDGSGTTGNIIYFMSIPLERLVSLKAFIETIKFNLTKENEIINRKSSDEVLFIEHAGDLEIDLSINIPATTVNEAANNLAKIEELQRLILPTAGSDYVSVNGDTIQPFFKVLFKNLISCGRPYKSIVFPNDINYDFMIRNGFQCIISSINYEPDMEVGFFEAFNYKWPKNIKLNLKLLYESNHQSRLERLQLVKPIIGFNTLGTYSDYDGGCFPFGLAVKTKGAFMEGYEVEQYKKDFYTEEINDLMESQGSNFFEPMEDKNGNFFFLSMLTKEDKEGVSDVDSHRKRYVVFKAFIDSFNRNVETDYVEIEDKSRDIGKKISPNTPVTYKSLSYKIKLMVPSASMAEAKKNCAKIQYLMRIFYRQADFDNYNVMKAVIESGDSSTVQADLLNSSHRKVKVYCPHFIEKPGATKVASYYDYFDEMWANSLTLFMSNLSFDINVENGFFTDNNGALYPKEMSIDLEFQAKSNTILSSYKYNPAKDNYTMIGNDFPGAEHLFPLNRKTVKIG